jgi:hypothetical protein
MEKIKERSMSTFVLSSFLGFGIGLAFGLIVGIIATITAEGHGAVITMLWLPISIGLITAIPGMNMYRIYFYYRLSLDINALCEGDGRESESYLVAAVLGSLTFGIYQLYWAYKLAQRLRVNAPRYGFKMFETGKDIVILDALSVGYIAAWELIKNVNRAARSYNQTGLANVTGGGAQ